jgi:hypothetical protein
MYESTIILDAPTSFWPSRNWENGDKNMSKGLDLAQLTSELEYRHDNRRDFIIGTETVAISVVNNEPRITFRDSYEKVGDFAMTRPMVEQVAECAGIMTARRAADVLMVYGSEAERKALAHYLTVVISETPRAVRIRTVSEFMEEPKATAFLSTQAQLGMSSFQMLTHVLGVMAEVGLAYLEGHVGDEYVTMKFVGEDKLGVMIQYSEIGRVNKIYGLALFEDRVAVTHKSLDWTTLDTTLVAESRDYLRSDMSQDNVQILANNFSIEALLEHFRPSLKRDERRRVIFHYNKRIQSDTMPTNLAVVYALSKYAKLAEISYERKLEFEQFAGTVLEWKEPHFEAFGIFITDEKKTTKRKANRKAGPKKTATTAAATDGAASVTEPVSKPDQPSVATV